MRTRFALVRDGAPQQSVHWQCCYSKQRIDIVSGVSTCFSSPSSRSRSVFAAISLLVSSCNLSSTKPRDLRRAATGLASGGSGAAPQLQRIRCARLIIGHGRLAFCKFSFNRSSSSSKYRNAPG